MRPGLVAGQLALACLLGVSLCARSAAAASDDDDDGKLADDSESSSTKSAEDSDAKHKAEDEKSESTEYQKSRFQIAFYTTLYSSTKLSFSLNYGGQLQHGSITEVSAGPSANPVTLELGYGLSDSFVLGLLLELGTTDTTTQSYGYAKTTLSTGRFLVGPRAEYSFGNSLRPFVNAVVGFTTVPQTGDSYSVSLTGVEFAGGLGLRWFVADGFSIEPSVRGTWGTGSGTVTSSIIMPPSGVPATGYLVSGAALLGISGWL